MDRLLELQTTSRTILPTMILKKSFKIILLLQLMWLSNHTVYLFLELTWLQSGDAFKSGLTHWALIIEHIHCYLVALKRPYTCVKKGSNERTDERHDGGKWKIMWLKRKTNQSLTFSYLKWHYVFCRCPVGPMWSPPACVPAGTTPTHTQRAVVQFRVFSRRWWHCGCLVSLAHPVRAWLTNREACHVL